MTRKEEILFYISQYLIYREANSTQLLADEFITSHNCIV